MEPSEEVSDAIDRLHHHEPPYLGREDDEPSRTDPEGTGRWQHPAIGPEDPMSHRMRVL